MELSHEETPTQFELGVALGVLMANGSFVYAGKRGTRSPSQARIAVKTKDRGTLTLLESTLGGKTYGPYRNGSGNNPEGEHYRWHLQGTELASVMPLIERMPDSPKRAQMIDWMQVYEPELAWSPNMPVAARRRSRDARRYAGATN